MVMVMMVMMVKQLDCVPTLTTALTTAFLGNFTRALNLLGGLVIHVGLAHLDQLDGVLIQLVEVVRSEVHLAGFPAQPGHILHDVVDELQLLGLGIGIIVTENGLSFPKRDLQGDEDHYLPQRSKAPLKFRYMLFA